jgi:aryl-alcohol dehydrogenase-like predicted oxidoreductase
MYGRAEEVIGDLTSAPGTRDKLFLATKVWTRGKESGIQSSTFHVAFAARIEST